jgi:hypothetical protein
MARHLNEADRVLDVEAGFICCDELRGDAAALALDDYRQARHARRKTRDAQVESDPVPVAVDGVESPTRPQLALPVIPAGTAEAAQFLADVSKLACAIYRRQTEGDISKHEAILEVVGDWRARFASGQSWSGTLGDAGATPR